MAPPRKKTPTKQTPTKRLSAAGKGKSNNTGSGKKAKVVRRTPTKAKHSIRATKKTKQKQTSAPPQRPVPTLPSDWPATSRAPKFPPHASALRPGSILTEACNGQDIHLSKTAVAGAKRSTTTSIAANTDKGRYLMLFPGTISFKPQLPPQGTTAKSIAVKPQSVPSTKKNPTNSQHTIDSDSDGMDNDSCNNKDGEVSNKQNVDDPITKLNDDVRPLAQTVTPPPATKEDGDDEDDDDDDNYSNEEEVVKKTKGPRGRPSTKPFTTNKIRSMSSNHLQFGKLIGLNTDKPKFSIPFPNGKNLVFPGQKVVTTSKYIMLSCSTRKKGSVVCKNIFSSAIVFGKPSWVSDGPQTASTAADTTTATATTASTAINKTSTVIKPLPSSSDGTTIVKNAFEAHYGGSERALDGHVKGKKPPLPTTECMSNDLIPIFSTSTTVLPKSNKRLGIHDGNGADDDEDSKITSSSSSSERNKKDGFNDDDDEDEEFFLSESKRNSSRVGSGTTGDKESTPTLVRSLPKRQASAKKVKYTHDSSSSEFSGDEDEGNDGDDAIKDGQDTHKGRKMKQPKQGATSKKGNARKTSPSKKGKSKDRDLDAADENKNRHESVSDDSSLSTGSSVSKKKGTASTARARTKKQPTNLTTASKNEKKQSTGRKVSATKATNVIEIDDDNDDSSTGRDDDTKGKKKTNRKATSVPGFSSTDDSENDAYSEDGTGEKDEDEGAATQSNTRRSTRPRRSAATATSAKKKLYVDIVDSAESEVDEASDPENNDEEDADKKAVKSKSRKSTKSAATARTARTRVSSTKKKVVPATEEENDSNDENIEMDEEKDESATQSSKGGRRPRSTTRQSSRTKKELVVEDSDEEEGEEVAQAKSRKSTKTAKTARTRRTRVSSTKKKAVDDDDENDDDESYNESVRDESDDAKKEENNEGKAKLGRRSRSTTRQSKRTGTETAPVVVDSDDNYEEEAEEEVVQPTTKRTRASSTKKKENDDDDDEFSDDEASKTKKQASVSSGKQTGRSRKRPAADLLISSTPPKKQRRTRSKGASSTSVLEDIGSNASEPKDKVGNGKSVSTRLTSSYLEAKRKASGVHDDVDDDNEEVAQEETGGVRTVLTSRSVSSKNDTLDGKKKGTLSPGGAVAKSPFRSRRRRSSTLMSPKSPKNKSIDFADADDDFCFG